MITLIVPFYNEEQHLRCSIGSIQQQTFQDFEVLLIDDLSSDGSYALAAELTAADSRFRLLRNAQKGLFNARNLALSEARGEYICFLDADDKLLPDYLTGLAACTLQCECDLIVQGFTHVIGGHNIPHSVQSPGLFSLASQADSLFASFNVVAMGNVFGKLYRRSLIEEHHLQFSPQVLLSEDMYFVLSYLVHCQQVYLSSKANYLYLAHKASMSTFYWDFPTEERSYLALKEAWNLLLGKYDCPSLRYAYGVFTGNYVNRLVFSALAHPQKSEQRARNLYLLETRYLPHFRQYCHPTTLFTQMLKWTAVHHYYLLYHALMKMAILRYGIVVNFG